ncbi:centrosomal protein of 76 kDa-like [Mytilus galloprovincialis]|uniref:centrosomal protein of 76 kDa-like n=1 Tax=Mytilus galloprovincialis TaxID=29158 RepID=UPI003F7C5059
MSVPPEKIAELKQIIHGQLSQIGMQSRIRDVMSEVITEDYSNGQVSEQEIMQKLKERGLVDDLMSNLQFQNQGDGQSLRRPATHFLDQDDKVTNLPVKRANIDPSRRYLYFNIKNGKAFLEHIENSDPMPGQVSSYFTFHIHFRGQRFKSRPVPCACEPDVDEGFLLEVHKESSGEAGKMVDESGMLSICDKLHIALIKTDVTGETTLVSSHFLEWRPVLTAKTGRFQTSIELKGTGDESKMAAGVIDIQLELFPKPVKIIGQEVLTAQLSMERNRQSEKERLFLVYAKQWWKEYLQIRPANQERLVKIFAQDENAITRPVCSFVKPLRAGRLLDSARHAARFVSLMHHKKQESVGGGNKLEQWTTVHGFLCRNRGDCEDHAILLCSLLLGFGLNAYVCIGTKSKGSVHAWVMTITVDGLVTFWESLNGHRYIHEPIDPDMPPMDKIHRPKYPYKTIGCVFNHQSFYGNNQPSEHVDVSHFELGNESRWKPMSQDAVLSVCGLGASPSWPTLPPLCSSTLDPTLVSNDLEQQLRVLLFEHRRDLGLTTVWDDQLSYLLTPALAAYELERVTGITAGNEEFQDSMKQCVPDGHTFKGYPIQFSHRNARRAFATCLRSPVCEEIVNCRGDHVRLAVRVKIYPYPESACATWIMFACKYKSVL